MFDAFPYDEWSEDIAEFWTFGGEGSTGTCILTILGFSVMLIAFRGFVVLENQKLTRQAAVSEHRARSTDPAAVVVTTIITTDPE